MSHDARKTIGKKIFFAAAQLEMNKDYMAKLQKQLKEIDEEEALREQGKKRF